MTAHKQVVYDVLNRMGPAIPNSAIDDNELLIDAYEKVCAIQDGEAQQVLLAVIRQLRLRNTTIGRIRDAWAYSAERLRGVCETLDMLSIEIAQKELQK